MSVIVKGMEMPDTCEECRISIEVGSDMHCPLFAGDIPRDFGRKADCGFECRPDWCPLHPLPEKHGRLIDGDALRGKMYHDAFETDSEMQRWDSGCWIRYKMLEHNIDDAETIVAAEGDDG